MKTYQFQLTDSKETRVATSTLDLLRQVAQSVRIQWCKLDVIQVSPGVLKIYDNLESHLATAVLTEE